MAVQFQPVDPAPASTALDAAWRELAEAEPVVVGAEGLEKRMAEAQAASDDVIAEKYGINKGRH
jgi:hypothetical protein